jgi:hypothetical protein
VVWTKIKKGMPAPLKKIKVLQEILEPIAESGIFH